MSSPSRRSRPGSSRCLFLVLAMIVFSDIDEQRLAQKWIAGAVLLATALNIYELFNPLTFSTIPGRSSGLYSMSTRAAPPSSSA